MHLWKKSCVKSRNKTFEKITLLLNEINNGIEGLGIKFGTWTEYAIEYMEQIIKEYVKLTGINPETISGLGSSGLSDGFSSSKEVLTILKSSI